MLIIKPAERENYPNLLSLSQLRKLNLMPAAGQKPDALVRRQMYGNYYLYGKDKCVPYVVSNDEKLRKRKQAGKRRALCTCPVCKEYKGATSGFESTREPGMCKACYLAKRDAYFTKIKPLPMENGVKKYDFLVFDVETTGLSVEYDEILQLSILSPLGDVLFYQTFCPQFTLVYPDASNVNGLPYGKVKDCPAIFDFLPMIHNIFLRTDTVMGYNVSFDKGFLSKLGIDLSSYKEIDVIKYFAEYYGEYDENRGAYRYKSLFYAASHFGFEFNAHNSKEDCFATLYVYQKLTEM